MASGRNDLRWCGHGAARPATGHLLQLEGLAALIAGAAVYAHLGGSWIAFVPLLLVPDLSTVGYVGGSRSGALTYNLFHNWATGLAALGAGLAMGAPILSFAGAILIAHVGMDRSVGYGLKLPTGFGDTHLGHVGKTRPASTTAAVPSSLAGTNSAQAAE